MNLSEVLEGRCPRCGAILERRDDCGWCSTCNEGHSATMHNGEGEYRLHLDVLVHRPDGCDRIVSGPGRVVIMRPLSDTPPTAD